MEKEKLEQLAFNVLMLDTDLPQRDVLACAVEIAMLCEISENNFSYFIQNTVQMLDAKEGSTAWKEYFVETLILEDKSEIIINLNSIF